MSVLWSEQQRQWLQAMGHRVLVLAGDEMPAAAAEPAVTAEPAHAAVPPAPQRTAHPVTPAIARSVESPAEQPLPSLAVGDRRLHRALLQATGQRTVRAAEAMLRNLQADPAALRDDAAGKRALWTRLRALRKAAQRA